MRTTRCTRCTHERLAATEAKLPRRRGWYSYAYQRPLFKRQPPTVTLVQILPRLLNIHLLHLYTKKTHLKFNGIAIHRVAPQFSTWMFWHHTFLLDWIWNMLHHQSDHVDQFMKTLISGTWNIYLFKLLFKLSKNHYRIIRLMSLQWIIWCWHDCVYVCW